MEYVKESQVLLDEELRAEPFDENEPRVKNTIRFRKNIRLSNKIAGGFSEPIDPAIDKEDIYQEAYLALWESCLNFDETKNVLFATYAVPMINGRIYTSFRKTEPVKTNRTYQIISSLLRKHNFTLPLSEEEVMVLMEEGKISKRAIFEYSELQILSFDAPTTHEDENTSLSEIIADPNINLDDISEDEIEKTVDIILSYMKPVHRDIIEEWIYATLSGVRISQRELAKKYNRSQSIVSRAINHAIEIVNMNADTIRSLFGL